MNQSLMHACAVALLCTCALSARAQSVPDPERGRLLYETHCIDCHTTRMHWRAARQARDWTSLEAQVRRWQGNASLGWDDTDIESVTRHLNDTIYKFPPPAAGEVTASGDRPTHATVAAE